MLYLADDMHCCFVETYGRLTGITAVQWSALAERSLSRVEAGQPLRLVDLSSHGLARLGADARLCAGDHAVAQRWAAALWNHPQQPDGLYYRARHDPARMALALYDRAAASLRATLVCTLTDPSFAPRLGEILDTYGFSLFDDA